MKTNAPPLARLLFFSLGSLLPALSSAEPARYPLNAADEVRVHNVVAEPAVFQGKKGLKVVAARKSENPTSPVETMAVINGLEFTDGVIEAEISGEVAPDAPEGARGFVGIAFRVQDDLKTYDAFYLRPTNGRADDQVRRNRSAQYIFHPDWPWFRLRKEFPGQYESYVDLVPGAWTRIRIEVSGNKARLFVHGAEQPTLVVNDVKSGAAAKGSIALWIDAGTVAHFRNVVVTRR
jgi:hypothetical protein